jgi:hypothetical protein
MLYKRLLLFAFSGGMLLAPQLQAQNKKTADAHDSRDDDKAGLFEANDIFHFKLTGKLNDLFNDRGDNMSFHPLLLEYFRKDSSRVTLHLQAKTRGHFRRLKENCKMPPLLLSFAKSGGLSNSVFSKQGKLKLVVPCQGDEYVIKEWLVYKLYNLITDQSLKARLVLVDFEDSLQKRKTESRYCILLEDEKKMAERNKTFVWNRKMLPMIRVNAEEFKTMAVFQYMIGNTDWGIPYLQNIILITKDSSKAPFAVPYDFDHAGIVDAPYAGAAPEFEMPNVRVRLYRGFCEKDLKAFAKTFELFNSLKKDFYSLYTDCALLKPKYVKYVTRYLDDFYKTINSSRDIDEEFGKPCRTDVRIEIKGLKE